MTHTDLFVCEHGAIRRRIAAVRAFG